LSQLLTQLRDEPALITRLRSAAIAGARRYDRCVLATQMLDSVKRAVNPA